MTSTTTPIKTIAFLGATGGCGLSALRRSLEAGHVCQALCRTPSRLAERLGTADSPANLHVVQGNAHSVADVAKVLVRADSADGSSPRLVDAVVFSIGGAPDLVRLTIDDPNVCEKGTRALLCALEEVRQQQQQQQQQCDTDKTDNKTQQSRAGPHIVVVSTNGISRAGRDYPLVQAPVYRLMLRVPHRDKAAMEALLFASAERWTIVRPSLLTDGGAGRRPVREGVEDPVAGRYESRAVGHTIAREDVGRWIFERCLCQPDTGLIGRAVAITY